jgi:very-short-patch-repair endonuclease
MSHQITARELRNTATWAEKELWRVLRSRRLSGYKFRRQHPQGPWFLDFYCIEAKVAVESDGLQHGFPGQQERDQKREAYSRRKA